MWKGRQNAEWEKSSMKKEKPSEVKEGRTKKQELLSFFHQNYS